MNVSISTDLMATAMSLSPPQPQSHASSPPEGGEGGPATYVSAMESSGGSISSSAKDTIYAGVEELEDSGASAEDIRAFVDNELEANGVEGSSRSGQLVDMMA